MWKRTLAWTCSVERKKKKKPKYNALDVCKCLWRRKRCFERWKVKKSLPIYFICSRLRFVFFLILSSTYDLTDHFLIQIWETIFLKKWKYTSVGTSSVDLVAKLNCKAANQQCIEPKLQPFICLLSFSFQSSKTMPCNFLFTDFFIFSPTIFFILFYTEGSPTNRPPNKRIWE